MIQTDGDHALFAVAFNDPHIYQHRSTLKPCP
jgi:hypothetical protein